MQSSWGKSVPSKQEELEESKYNKLYHKYSFRKGDEVYVCLIIWEIYSLCSKILKLRPLNLQIDKLFNQWYLLYIHIVYEVCS